MDYAIIFDMDGVIIDSNPYHKIAWDRFLTKRGIHFDDDLFDNTLSGRTGISSIRLLMGQELTLEVVNKYVHEIDKEFLKILGQDNNVGPIPGLPGFLKNIKSSGTKTALATSAPPENVDLTLEKTGLRSYFDMILDKNDVTNGKPDPEVYLKTVMKLNAQKKDCIVFEDSKMGIKSALNAGLRVIGVSTSHNREELLEEGVSMVIDDFTALDPEDVFSLL